MWAGRCPSMVLADSRYRVVSTRPRLPAIIVLIGLSFASGSPCVHTTAVILRYTLILGSKPSAAILLRIMEAIILKWVWVTSSEGTFQPSYRSLLRFNRFLDSRQRQQARLGPYNSHPTPFDRSSIHYPPIPGSSSQRQNSCTRKSTRSPAK